MSKLTIMEMNLCRKITNTISLIQSISIEEYERYKKKAQNDRKKEMRMSNSFKKIKRIKEKRNIYF